MVEISRREFIKISGMQLTAALVPLRSLLSSPLSNTWPIFYLDQLPRKIQQILNLVPITEMDDEGRLVLYDQDGELKGRVKLLPTEWSKQHRTSSDFLYDDKEWGIVLHWFGDRERHNLDVNGYLQGFDGEQVINGKKLRTSSHFLIGAGEVNLAEIPSNVLGIVQTQEAGPFGKPYVSSHLLPAPFEGLADPRNYFIRAMDKVFFTEPNAYSILQEFSRDTRLDPNMVTLSIEIAGYDFDSSDNYPERIKIANVVSVVWAIMKRYSIPAINILGHLEINLDKPDPGKKFLSLIRFLIGVKALLSSDDGMKDLVFSPFYSGDRRITNAVYRYFHFVREYLLLISDPKTVYEWESESMYWFVHDLVAGTPQSRGRLASQAQFPLGWLASYQSPDENSFPLQEGITILANDEKGRNQVKLMAHGECVYWGTPPDSNWGKTVVFRHRENNGGEVTSLYTNLDRFGFLRTGDFYHRGHLIGEIDSSSSFLPKALNFSIAYAGAWEKDLQHNLTVPINAEYTWIKKRFIDPQVYIRERIFSRPIDEKQLEIKLLSPQKAKI